MYLYDIQQAAALVVDFTAGKQLDAYLADPMLRAAVERQLEIIGEALTQLGRVDSQLLARITDHKRIIAFRNILAHGYFEIDHEIVWGTVQSKLAVLRDEIESLLNEGETSEEGL
jgi:uncharacterized protein with HEPN domain